MRLRILFVFTAFILLSVTEVAWSESHLDIVTGTGQIIRQEAFTEGEVDSRETIGEYYLIPGATDEKKLKFVSLKNPNNIDPNMTLIEVELGEVGNGGMGMTSRMVDITDTKSFKGLESKLAKLENSKGISFNAKSKLALLHQIQIQNSKKSNSLAPNALNSLKGAKKIKLEIERRGNDFAVLLIWPNCQHPLNRDISGSCSLMDGATFFHYVVPWES